jgi:hypothetical protein
MVIVSLALGIAALTQRSVTALKPGDPAPNFKLQILRSKDSFELKSNFGKRPTVLIFGSYT